MARGSILVEEAYARGKMLDHSGWHVLPRAITPSDFDMVFDNGGALIYGEISSEFSEWARLKKGQRKAYSNAIWQTRNCAVLCRHNVPLSELRAINTREDIRDYQVMLYDGKGFSFSSVRHDWKEFVDRWFANPIETRNSYLRQAIRAAA